MAKKKQSMTVAKEYFENNGHVSGRRKRSNERAEQLHADLREIWAAVSEQPGVTYTEISKKVGFSRTKVRRLVGLLLDSGTLVVAKGECRHKSRTLRATVPLVSYSTLKG